MPGYMTLDEMTNEVSLNLGGKAPARDRLKLWVNFGLLNLVSYIKFDEMRKVADFPIVDGTTSYAMPTDLLGIVTIEVGSIADGTRKKLTKMRRRYTEPSTPGQPSAYLRRETNIIVWPEPDADYDGEIEYVKVPARLTAGASTSPVNASWDVGIVMLATHHGFLSLDEQDKADRWLGRFLGYASSRLKEEDISADIPKGGLNVAWDWEDVIDTPPHLLESD